MQALQALGGVLMRTDNRIELEAKIVAEKWKAQWSSGYDCDDVLDAMMYATVYRFLWSVLP